MYLLLKIMINIYNQKLVYSFKIYIHPWKKNESKHNRILRISPCDMVFKIMPPCLTRIGCSSHAGTGALSQPYTHGHVVVSRLS